MWLLKCVAGLLSEHHSARVNGSETLQKSEREHLDPTFFIIVTCIGVENVPLSQF